MGEFSKWFGAGVLAAGLMTATIAGAGVAMATEGSSTDGAVAAAADSKNAENAESEAPGTGDQTAEVADDDKGDDGLDNDALEDDLAGEFTDDDLSGDLTDPTDDDLTEEDVTTDTPVAAEDIADNRGSHDSDTDIETADIPTAGEAAGDFGDSTLETEEPGLEDALVAESSRNIVQRNESQDNQRLSVFVARTLVDAEDAPETTPVAFAAPAEAAIDASATTPRIPGIVRMIGTFVFNLYGLATKLLGGPPILPANSSVTVRTSTLVLDCGCAPGETYEVQADWYFPEVEEGQQPPDRLIYLQHGFLARGPWYSHTAAALAEQTNSIVVAPSITSNFFAADACWLGATPMHESMARLFDADNTALADSAAAVGYDGPIPDRVVLIGHSLGGGAVIGIAGAMAGKEAEQRLAGVIMLDGVPFDPKASEKIAAVDPDIPIYNLAAPRYFWNQNGVGTDALAQARPGEFIGVTLTNGSHVDPMRGGNPLIQFAQELVAGFVRPENGDAAQILMIEWANEMFAGVSQVPITDPFTIDTPSGAATAVPLPNDLTRSFFLNPLQQFVSLGDGLFTLDPVCVQESIATCSASTAA